MCFHPPRLSSSFHPTLPFWGAGGRSDGGGQRTGPVRHPVDTAALDVYLSASGALPGFAAPCEASQFTFGQSNPTFLLKCPGTGAQFVLRKQPSKVVVKGAHDMGREVTVMRALADTDVPVPRVYVYCQDDTVIGTPFYVMQFVEGRVFVDASMPGASPAERSAVYAGMVRVLAALHAVKPSDVGLDQCVWLPCAVLCRAEVF